jgi:hypothetical protein
LIKKAGSSLSMTGGTGLIDKKKHGIAIAIEATSD